MAAADSRWIASFHPQTVFTSHSREPGSGIEPPSELMNTPHTCAPGPRASMKKASNALRFLARKTGPPSVSALSLSYFFLFLRYSSPIAIIRSMVDCSCCGSRTHFANISSGSNSRVPPSHR